MIDSTAQPPAFAPDTPLATQISPSPNHGERRGIEGPDCIILHYTGMPTAEGARALLCDPASEVSCHYLVYEDGAIAQLVPESRRAWHAGRSFWQGETDLNSRSLGVEIVNPGHSGGCPPFPKAQMAAVVALVEDMSRRWSIAPERVLAHSDIAPGRKIDPGEYFPWNALEARGLARKTPDMPPRDGLTLALGALGAPVADLQDHLRALGFDPPASGVYDATTATIVAAFQRRFRRECVDGAADPQTRDRLAGLVAPEA